MASHQDLRQKLSSQAKNPEKLPHQTKPFFIRGQRWDRKSTEKTSFESSQIRRRFEKGVFLEIPGTESERNNTLKPKKRRSHGLFQRPNGRIEKPQW